MAKNLLIVESPAKARTIRKYLGKDFEVLASVGHVVDLPPSRLGVDVDKDFEPEYQVIKGKEKVVSGLRKAAKAAQAIYLAPDPDREGEAIAWHIAERLGGDSERIHRVLFHELTKNAIFEAMANPQRLDQNRFNSQQARRVLDRLVGYQLSPLLWDKVRQGLSAGRVQSVALRLVVERERQIRAFEPQEYWSITASLAADEPPIFQARLAKLAGKKFAAGDEEQARAALEALKGARYQVQKVVQRQRRQRPPAPFITSTLQQEAFRKLGFTPKKTMSLAQRLYEGQQTPQGQVGLITYMRTDSRRLSAQAVAEARDYIRERDGGPYLPAKAPVYKAAKGAQEAHEAIRPTSVRREPEALAAYLGKDELALYRLIWTRFVACQMAPAVYDQTQAEILAGPGLFRASGQVLKFPGYTTLYQEGIDESQPGKEDGKLEALPPLRQGQDLELKQLTPKQHFTQPPPRFTLASLVREMEERGIGRPSTYAAVLATLQDKSYVLVEKRKLKPTELGEVVSDLLVENFPRVMDVDFTAGLEESLDEVEEGRVDWRKLLADFYGPFSQALDQARSQMRAVKRQGLATDVPCPTCGKPMLLRLGRQGEFLACTDYPRCKTSRDFSRDDKGRIVPAEPAPDPGVTCDKCGSAMLVKRSKYGPFLACSNYPQCKNLIPLDENGQPVKPQPLGEKCPQCGGELVIKPTKNGGRFIACSNFPRCRYSRGLPVGVDCPECGKPLVERKSRRGKVFYGCEGYPQCKFATWDKPLPEACPDCAYGMLVEKTTKKGTSIICPRKGCGYRREKA